MNRVNIAAGKINKLWIFLMGRQSIGEKHRARVLIYLPLFLFTFKHYMKTEFLSLSEVSGGIESG